MKKILVLVNRTPKNKNSFYVELKKNCPEDIQVDIAQFEDITIDIEENNTSLMIKDKSILDYDLVYFRRAGREFLWLAATIAVFLESKGKKYFDTTYREIGPAGAKLTSLLKLALAEMPVIPTYFCYKENVVASAGMIIKKFGLPIVAKDFYSQRGTGVFLIKTIEDFQELINRFPEKKFLFQKFINKKEEFRVLVLGNTIGSYERKTTTDPNEFRNNVSLGAKEDFMEIKDMAEEVKEISVRSSQIVKIEIAGVDIIVDTDGKLWILEVNRGPGFTYDSVKSNEMTSVADFLTKEVRKI